MRVLITGGTGSLGHALTQYYLENTDARVIVLSRDEVKQAAMRRRFPDGRLDFYLGDVRDRDRLRMACEAGVDMVVHAAALKRVDAVAHDPDEVLHTNVLGTRNLLHAARGVIPRCLLISTDKACYPTNAYGRSKAMAEDLCTAFNVYGSPKGTRSSVLRYGNVIGSRGSVLEVWKDSPTLTLTHRSMTRFLITMEQAVSAVVWALERMEGGETFVPRLPAATMVDLAEAYRPGVSTVEVGLRPGGEKLHETLLTKEEGQRAWDEEVGSQVYTVIPPHLHPWREKWVYGEPVGHQRSSDLAQWLDVDEIREVLHGAGLLHSM